MGTGTQQLVIGIGGHVVAVDPATGGEIWRTKVKRGEFVTVAPAGSVVFACAGGELFCLDAAGGQILWHNKLKGLGTGLISFAGSEVAVSAAQLAARRRAAMVAAAGASS
jgi:outer membrane protein assembly factor BamB